VSAIAPRFGKIEDDLQAKKVKVFSISPHARTHPENPLVVPEANGEAMMQSLWHNMDLGCKTLPLIKSPNCVTCGISVVLKAVDEAFGLEGVAVTTFQALSGRGDAKYDPALVVGNVYPLTGTEERTDEYQRSELMRIFPGITRCSVSAHRVPVQTGHFVDVKAQTRKKINSATAVKDVMRQFNPLDGLNLPSQPKMPIVVVDEPGRPRPLNDADYENGMAVAVGNIRTDDGFFDLTFSVVLNNVARGAWGAALINAEFYHLHVRPIIESKRDKHSQHRHLESISSDTCWTRETSLSNASVSTDLDSIDSDKESMDEANRCVL
jgi:aspartate-semialdehyde dehydrogenase